MAQFARPASDVATGGWTTTPLWSKVDDAVSAADGTVITSDNNTSPDNADFSLTSIDDPGSSTGHVIRALWNKDASAGHAINAVAELWQGVPGTGTLVATLSITGIGATPQTDAYTLSAAEADSITDYSTLHLRVSRQGDTGGNPNGRRSLVVDAVELETPDAQAGITGTMDATEAIDTLSASGSVSTTGTLSTTEAADTLSASGEVSTTGELSATEPADTLAASGSVEVEGTLNATEVQDTFEATEDTSLSGTLSATEVQDSLTAAGEVLIAGALAASEPTDTLSAAGTLSYIGQLAAMEATDGFNGAGQVLIAGTLEASEPSDIFSGVSADVSATPPPFIVPIARRRRRTSR